MLFRDVAPGVHRIEDSFTNWYLIEADDGITVVDAGVPSSWDEDGELPVPGRPRVVFTPGHTLGHCALHLPDRDAVIAGDAVVMLDPYTARTGPRIAARATPVA